MELREEYSKVLQVTEDNIVSWGTIEPYDTDIPIDPGYLVVFVDNQSIGRPVWFDNINIEHYNGQVLDQNHYYPFGLTHLSSAVSFVEQPYKYNTKELERSFGLEMYDYGARQHDPQLGRFWQVDPLAEKYFPISPFAYVANNPVYYIDPDGREIRGATRKDAQNFKSDIHLTLANKKFERVRALIDIKGRTFGSIDATALKVALDGTTLSADERTYIDMVTNTINSTEVHNVEYLTANNDLSASGFSALNSYLNELQSGSGDALRQRREGTDGSTEYFYNDQTIKF